MNITESQHEVITSLILEKQKLERERDEARDLADRYRVAFCSANGDLVPQVFPWEDSK